MKTGKLVWGWVWVDMGGCCIKLQGLLLHWRSPTSLSGPWSDKQASPALQRNMSNMAMGPRATATTRLHTENSPNGEQESLPFDFSSASFLLIIIIFHGGGVERVTFSLIFTSIQNKTVVSMAYHKAYHAVVLPYWVEGVQARATASCVLRTWLWELVGASAPTQLQLLLHPFYKGGCWGPEVGNSWIRVLAGTPYHWGLSSGGLCLSVGSWISSLKRTSFFWSTCGRPMTAPRASMK